MTNNQLTTKRKAHAEYLLPKFCPHCGRKLTPSHINGYTYECKNCDEDFYAFEAREKK